MTNVHIGTTFFPLPVLSTPTPTSAPTDMYEVPDAVPPIHAVSSHVATDKDPSKFRSMFSDNLQPIATRGKKARGTLVMGKIRRCHVR